MKQLKKISFVVAMIIAHYGLSSFKDVNIISPLKNYSFEEIRLKSEITFSLQSPTYYIDGCNYYFTASVTFVFDDDGAVTGHYFSYPQLHYSCSATSYLIRGVNPAMAIERNTVTDLRFELTNNPQLDAMLSNSDFLQSIKNILNENIKQ